MKSQHNHICNIMGLISIYRKNKMKKAPLLKSSLLVQIGEEIIIYKHQFALMTPYKAL